MGGNVRLWCTTCLKPWMEEWDGVASRTQFHKLWERSGVLPESLDFGIFTRKWFVNKCVRVSVTTPHCHKCQGEPMKKAKNSQGFRKAMMIENLYAKKTYRKPRCQGEQRIAQILWKKPRSGHTGACPGRAWEGWRAKRATSAQPDRAEDALKSRYECNRPFTLASLSINWVL